MPELKLISPLLDGMELEHCVSAAGGTSVYLLHSLRSDRPYILKHISIPESQTQVDALLFTGAASDEAAAQAYYEQVVQDYLDELKELDALRGSANFATYVDYQVVKKETGVGFEIYLLSEKWPTLVEYLSENAMTHLRALNLGLDLCTALCDLRVHGLIHRNIKPENIYLNGLNGFMLGDLGVARIDDLKYCAMPDHMVTEYTAPEITDILCDFNTTVDIYSIGMVLYRILNGNHGPFEDEQTSSKAANKRRTSGEALPSPLYCDYELAEILLKACAFEPTDRYQAPEELMQDLVLYMKRNSVTDSLIVPPIITDPELAVPTDLQDEEIEPVRFADVEAMDEEFVTSFAPEAAEPAPEDAAGGAAQPAFAAPHTSMPQEDDEPAPALPAAERPKKRSKTWIPIVIAVVLLAAIGVSLFFLFADGPAVQVTEFALSDRSADSLTVQITLDDPSVSLQVQCADTYGNTQSASYTGQPVTFTGLEPGAQYTLSLASDRHSLAGETTLRVSTVANTEVVSFTAESPLAGQAELTLVVSGPSPEAWTVRCTAEGAEPQEVTFSGSTVSIFNLETGLDYTFELLPPDGIALSGNTTLSLRTGPEIEIRNLEAADVSKDAIRVVWTCGSDVPDVWSVTCTGTDGSTKTQSVTECEAEFTGLSTGETYTITVTSDGTLQPATIAATPAVANISGFQAALQEDGSARVTWSADVSDLACQLVWTIQDSPLTQRRTVEGGEATLTDLLPGVTYLLELRSEAGEKLGGEATATLTTDEPGKFDAYGASRFFLGTFLCPEKANWQRKDLTVSVTDFSVGQRMAFALESLTGREDSEDEITVLYVIEDDHGVPVMSGSSTAVWDEMWPEDGVFLGEVTDPFQTAGEYTLRIYFNDQRVAAKEFTVE